jgi:hypothetical protein
MSCPEFTTLHNIGICGASAEPYIPGLDVMGRFCFRDNYHECSHFQEYILKSDARPVMERYRNPEIMLFCKWNDVAVPQKCS